MVYGQSQYYHEELNAWTEVVKFRKRELQALLRQVNVLLNFPVVSIPVFKTGDAFQDRLIVLEQQFDFLGNHAAHQLQRLERVVSDDGIDVPMIELQKSLRAKMKACEMTFIKAKYDSSIFLSEFFEANSFQLHV